MKALPEPTVQNLMDGLDILWPSLNASNGDFRLHSMQLKFTELTSNNFSEATITALSKKGWTPSAIDSCWVFFGML